MKVHTTYTEHGPDKDQAFYTVYGFDIPARVVEDALFDMGLEIAPDETVAMTQEQYNLFVHKCTCASLTR